MNVCCFIEGLPMLGLTLAASFLCHIVTSSLAVITSCTAVFMASVASWVIACVVVASSVASIAYLFVCLFSRCSLLAHCVETAWFAVLIEIYFRHHAMLLVLVKITLTEAYIHIYCLHLCYYNILP